MGLVGRAKIDDSWDTRGANKRLILAAINVWTRDASAINGAACVARVKQGGFAMTVPAEEIREEDGVRFVTMKSVEKHHTEEEVKTFKEWMTGQTGVLASDGTCGIYVYDYKRWIRQGKLKDQLPGDWD